MCDHTFIDKLFRITWSGRFKLIQAECSKCKLIQERSVRVRMSSSYPSKEWFPCQI